MYLCKHHFLLEELMIDYLIEGVRYGKQIYLTGGA